MDVSINPFSLCLLVLLGFFWGLPLLGTIYQVLYEMLTRQSSDEARLAMKRDPVYWTLMLPVRLEFWVLCTFFPDAAEMLLHFMEGINEQSKQQERLKDFQEKRQSLENDEEKE